MDGKIDLCMTLYIYDGGRQDYRIVLEAIDVFAVEEWNEEDALLFIWLFLFLIKAVVW